MFREILITAGVAGLLAALLLTLMQAALITPLILQAENYEATPAATRHMATDAGIEAHAHAPVTANSEHVHQHADGHSHQHTEAIAEPAVIDSTTAAAPTHDRHHDADAWQPQDGLERTLFTLASNIVMGFGYALLLTGIYVGWRRPSGIGQGLLFGLAGFAVFFAAPGLGLPPELPGTAAAEVAVRQQWWIGTALATALGLALLFMQKNIVLRGIGVIVLIAPHIIGAPQPPMESSLAPMELQHQFRLATTLGNIVFWLLLGAASALALKKFSNSQNV